MTTLKLPSGISYLPTRDGIKYTARFMVGGARISLGTHETLADAINAMYDFKITDMEKQRTQALAACGIVPTAVSELEAVKAELTSVESTMLASYRELLESIPPHELSFDADASIGGITIPAKIVTAFLHERFGEE